METCLTVGKRQADKIPHFQKVFPDISPLGTKSFPILACFFINGMMPVYVSVTIVAFLAATGNVSGPKSRANERSYGAP